MQKTDDNNFKINRKSELEYDYHLGCNRRDFLDFAYKSKIKEENQQYSIMYYSYGKSANTFAFALNCIIPNT